MMESPDVYAKKCGDVYKLYDRANNITFPKEFKSRSLALKSAPDAQLILRLRKIDCDCLHYSDQNNFLNRLRDKIEGRRPVMLKADATVEEKSLALAKLMNKATYREGFHSWWMPYYREGFHSWWMPYADNERGLAQFAAILLEFPEVMRRFDHVGPYGDGTGGIQTEGGLAPTQENFLDELLRMEGEME